MKITTKKQLRDVLYTLLVGAESGEVRYQWMTSPGDDEYDGVATNLSHDTLCKWISAIRWYFGLDGFYTDHRSFHHYESIATATEFLWQCRNMWALPGGDDPG